MKSRSRSNIVVKKKKIRESSSSSSSGNSSQESDNTPSNRVVTKKKKAEPVNATKPKEDQKKMNLKSDLKQVKDEEM